MNSYVKRKVQNVAKNSYHSLYSSLQIANRFSNIYGDVLGLIFQHF